MAANFGTNLDSLLTQALGQLDSIGKDSNTTSSSKKNTFINSIYTVSNGAEGIIAGNGEEKTKSITNMIVNILNLISSSKNEVSKANKDTKKNADEIDKNQKAADAKSDKIEKSIEEIKNSITNNTANIEKALKAIEELGSNNGEIAEVQKQITEQLEIIEKAKEDLKDPNKRKEALETIKGAADLINNIVGNITSMEDTINEQNAIVNESVTNISSLIEESATQISEGIAEITEHIKASKLIGAKTKAVITQGTINQSEGKSLITAGNKINSNLASAAFSGGKGIQMVTAGNNYVTAGTTRVTGGTNNVKSLTSSIGQIGTTISKISGYTEGVGQIGNGVATLAQQYVQTVQPYIEATGSWDVKAIKEANAEFQEQVKSADEILKENQDNKGNEDYLDTSKFKQAFGI